MRIYYLLIMSWVMLFIGGLFCTAYAMDMSESAQKRLIDLDSAIEYLEESGNLIRVKSEVDPKYELAGIAAKYEGDKPVLFENVKGSQFPVIIGILWNRDILGQLFDLHKEQIPFSINTAIKSWNKNKSDLKENIREHGPANQVIMDKPDLYKLPVPIHALDDGGRYFDAAVVVAKNPKTGALNTSIHRMMITEKDRMTFLIDPGRHLGEYVKIMEEKDEPLDVTINVGVGLAPWITSAIPRQGDGKYRIAHHMVGRPIDLIKAQTVDVPAYAQAQFVVEAEILPNVREEEGPFAEVSGYYAEREKRWVMKVKTITHQKDPTFHSLLSGQEVWNAVGLTAEASIYNKLQDDFPQLEDIYLDPGGCGFYGAVLQLGENKQDVGKEIIKETFKVFPSLQRVVVVDDDVNIYDCIDVNWALTTRFDPASDLVILEDQPGHILNPIVQKDPDREGGMGGTVTKIGFDATTPHPRPDKFKRVQYIEPDLDEHNIIYGKK